MSAPEHLPFAHRGPDHSSGIWVRPCSSAGRGLFGTEVRRDFGGHARLPTSKAAPSPSRITKDLWPIRRGLLKGASAPAEVVPEVAEADLAKLVRPLRAPSHPSARWPLAALSKCAPPSIVIHQLIHRMHISPPGMLRVTPAWMASRLPLIELPAAARSQSLF
jgi:hypothetical protein